MKDFQKQSIKDFDQQNFQKLLKDFVELLNTRPKSRFYITFPMYDVVKWQDIL